MPLITTLALGQAKANTTTAMSAIAAAIWSAIWPNFGSSASAIFASIAVSSRVSPSELDILRGTSGSAYEVIVNIMFINRK